MIGSFLIAALVSGGTIHGAVPSAPMAPWAARTEAVSATSTDWAESQMFAFGATVAISGDQAFVGEPRGLGAGTVHLYRRSGNTWRAAGKLYASDSSRNDGFGSAIVVSGNALLVAKIGAFNGADSARGAVHTFRRGANGSWEPTGILHSSEPMARAAFGAAIHVMGDMAYIGAPGEGSGAVHTFRRGANGAWTSAGKLPTATLESTDRFGTAIAADGDRLMVGAPGRSTNKGAVFTYVRSSGGWTPDAMVMPSRTTDNARFGSSLLVKGNRLIVGAPGALPLNNPGGPSAGLVTMFEYSTIAEIWKEKQSFASFLNTSARFGQTLAMVGDELWIGAPASARNTGHIFRVKPDANGSFTGMTMLEVAGIEPGSQFSASIAVSGDVAAVGMPSDAGGEGTVMFLSRAGNGSWASAGTVFPAPVASTLAQVKGKEMECGTDGKVADFECTGTALSSFLPISAIGGKRGTQLNDNWGWTDPVTKREIAILGRTDGTSFVDVSDPANPRYLGDLPKTKGQPSSSWRDMKVYKDHAFIVSDNAGEHGMQVFDLTRLRDVKEPKVFEPDVIYDRVNSAHNIVSNVETGFMYIVGSSGGGETCGGGYHMVDVREPKKPKFAGCFGDPRTGRAGTGYSHDAQCVKYKGPDTKYTGKEICIGSNETGISIADLTDKKNPVAISRASYPNVAYAHQAWFTDDHRYLYLNDEGDESSGQGEAAKGTRTLVWDLSDLSDPILVKEHVGVAKAIDHNLYVLGDRMYQANYTSGLRILDISDPKNPKEVGYIDTHPGDDGRPSFAGAWSVFPYFDSGTIVVTSIGEGVFFVKDRTKKVVQ